MNKMLYTGVYPQERRCSNKFAEHAVRCRSGPARAGVLSEAEGAAHGNPAGLPDWLRLVLVWRRCAKNSRGPY
ncbi:MAG: hypothetical protein ACYTEK_15840 [Planctomycetota bacterium]